MVSEYLQTQRLADEQSITVKNNPGIKLYENVCVSKTTEVHASVPT